MRKNTLKRDKIGQKYYDRWNCYTTADYIKEVAPPAKYRWESAIKGDIAFEEIIRKYFRIFVDCNSLHLRRGHFLQSNYLPDEIEKMRESKPKDSWLETASQGKRSDYFSNRRETNLFYDLLKTLGELYKNKKYCLTESQVRDVANHFFTKVCLQQMLPTKTKAFDSPELKQEPSAPKIIEDYFFGFFQPAPEEFKTNPIKPSDTNPRSNWCSQSIQYLYDIGSNLRNLL